MRSHEVLTAVQKCSHDRSAKKAVLGANSKCGLAEACSEHCLSLAVRVPDGASSVGVVEI